MGKRGWRGPVPDFEQDPINRLDRGRDRTQPDSGRVPTADRFRYKTADFDSQAVRNGSEAAGPELGAKFKDQRARRDHLTRIAYNYGFNELASRISATMAARIDLDSIQQELEKAIQSK